MFGIGGETLLVPDPPQIGGGLHAGPKVGVVREAAWIHDAPPNAVLHTMNASDSESVSVPSDPTGEPSPSPPSALAARLFNVYAAPGEVFDEVRARPPSTANWVVPMLLLMVVSAVGAWLVFSQPAFQQQQDEAQARFMQRLVEKGKVPPEAAAAQDTATPRSRLKYTLGPTAGAIVTSLAAPFWGALLLWIIGAKLLKGGFSYGKALEAAGLACMIDVLGALVKTLLILATANLQATVSPALALREVDWFNPAHLALVSLDLFALWLYAVRAVAMARLGRLRLGVCLASMFGCYAGLVGLMMGVMLGFRALLGL